MDDKPLNGKASLVTGGARRIGREIALSLARAGADVAITYRNSKSEAAGTVEQIQALGRRGIAIECDVRSEESVRGAVTAAIEQFCRLDILVNNAAIFESASLESLTLEQWDAVFETNTRGPFLFAREALPALRAARGRIVNLGSLGGLQFWPDHAHYCAAKAAVHSLTKTMARAFAPEVSVNCVAPGAIVMEEHPGPAAERFASRTPMRRNGAAGDVAQAVLFLVSGPEFITGQI